MLCSEGVVIVDSPGVGESHKVLCCVQEGVVIVDSPGVGESNKVLCCVQEGVVIVDSPGVGESNKVSRQLEHYISRAFGFIYVINISNAGGIQKDRVSQFIHISKKTFESLYFVFNNISLLSFFLSFFLSFCSSSSSSSSSFFFFFF